MLKWSVFGFLWQMHLVQARVSFFSVFDSEPLPGPDGVQQSRIEKDRNPVCGTWGG